MSLRTEYDIWHQRVFDADPGHADESSPWYRLVLEYLGPVEGRHILEIACGRGGFVRQLTSRGAHAFGADFSISALRIAQEKLQRTNGQAARASLVQADAQRLPYAGNSFDAVLSCETIEHLPDPQSALREMWRVTRPGGQLFLTTPNYLNWMGLYELYAIVRRPHRRAGQPFDRRQIFLQVRRWLRRAGWEILRSDGTVHQFPFIPGRNPVAFPWLESNRALRRILSPVAFHYFVIGRKRSPA